MPRGDILHQIGSNVPPAEDSRSAAGLLTILRGKVGILRIFRMNAMYRDIGRIVVIRLRMHKAVESVGDLAVAHHYDADAAYA